MIYFSSMSVEAHNNDVSFRGSLWVGKHSVNLFSDKGDVIDHTELKNPSAFRIPGWKFDETPSESEYSIIYRRDENSSLDLDSEDKSLTVRGRPEDFESGQSFAFLAFWLTELQRQEQSAYTIYSAALAIDKKGALLLGPSGAGKTSVLLKLCQIGNCEVVSNNLTLVSHNPESHQINLDDGTKEIRPRLAAVNDFPELKDKLTSKLGNVSWETQVNITPEEVGATIADGPRQLSQVFEIHYDIRGQDGLIIKRENGLDVRYRLYENMSRILRGTAISVFGKDNHFLGYMPSLDTIDLHERRVQAIETMVNDIGVMSISGGNLFELAEVVYSTITKKD